ncbi:TrmB family transcriptional regulator [Halobium palmae]|uniref:TrmB family transcriptional regulator n=1 Tax=Halobium palmae TaxID=1776492 RepID=A0ABD5RUW9_9EURY
MKTEQLRGALQSAGVTQYEADAYIALLERGSAAAVEVAEASGVPQARIYDVLRNLANKGYIETYEEGTLKAHANDPKTVVEDLEDYAETITTAASEIQERWQEPDIEKSKVSVVSQPRTVYDRARAWIKEAETEIQIALTPKQLDDLHDVLCDAYQRDVVVKLTLTPPSDTTLPVEEFSDRFENCVYEARYRDLPTPFVLLVDRTNVCFAPEASLPTASQYGVIVQDYSLSRVFDWFFQTALWTHWTVVYSTRTQSLPATYTNIRECIRHMKPLFDDGKRVVLTVEGHYREDGNPIELMGEVTNIVYADPYVEGESPPLETFISEAQITLDADGKSYKVGGWGALMEDIEAERFTVELIDNR